ncbi:carbohydrate ABC transporter permease [Micromonospora citrea]|uniref:carbohydrate ABC transporter permease n=1 Tax=Micromonospora citrea TaxID=47855 RepID=UPI003C5ACC4D
MTVRTHDRLARPRPPAGVGPVAPRERWSFLDRETPLGYLLVLPMAVVVLGLVGYPLLLTVWFSLTDKALGSDTVSFVGLSNYLDLLDDPVFGRTMWNTFNYTVTAVLAKLVLGLVMALALNEVRRFRRFFRAAFLLPWVVPSSLSVLAWMWMFQADFSVLTYLGRQAGLVDGNIPWLGEAGWAMAAVQTVNIWRGAPFFGIIILAGLATVPKELVEAAVVDGANAWQRLRYIILPHLTPILVVVTLFSFVQTLGDFQIVWILTNGGPVNSTHLISTLAFRTGIRGADIAAGSAISFFVFPALAAIIALQLTVMRRKAK